MISFEEAKFIISQNTNIAKIINVDLLDSLNMICAMDILAKINVPSFDNSAMDGFGVKVEWLRDANNESPISITKSQTIAAGEIVENKSEFATCHIMTGAKIPSWVEAVVPIENTKNEDDKIIFSSPVKLGQNIRRAGEDTKIDDILIKAQTKITPEIIMVLASQGISKIAVYDKPKIKIISTGNEIKPYNSGPLEDGQIYNSNAPYIISKAKQLGIEAEFVGIFQDEIAKFADYLDRFSSGSIIISTGAVSAGKWDFVPEALKLIGAKIHFHKVNIRPGKPILFATLRNGSLFFGLPGNPISSAIGFEFFVKYALKIMCAIPTQPYLQSKLANNFTKKFSGTQFLKASTKFHASGLETTILEGQESFKIKSFADANSWVILDETSSELKSNDIVDIKFFNL